MFNIKNPDILDNVVFCSVVLIFSNTAEQKAGSFPSFFISALITDKNKGYNPFTTSSPIVLSCSNT